MNDQQQDELLALSAIFGDVISWRRDDDLEAVQVFMRADIDLEEPRELHIWDWIEPAGSGGTTLDKDVEPSIRAGQGHDQDTSRRMANMTLQDEPSQQSSRPSSSDHSVSGSSSSAKSGRARKRRGGRREGQMTGMTPGQTVQASRSQDSSGASAPRSSPARQRLNESAVAQASVVATPAAAQAAPTTTVTVSTRSNPSKSILLTLVPARQTHVPVPPVASTSTIPEDVTPQPSVCKVRYLPPLEISLRLPQGYPSESAPFDVQVTDEIAWLGAEHRTALTTALTTSWTGEECLYAMLELVIGPALISTLNLEFPLTLHQTKPDHLRQTESSQTTAPALSDAILSHDQALTRASFEDTTFACALCLSSLKGAACIALSRCSHVFCRACLRDYFTLLITEGLVRGVACPAEECTRIRTVADKRAAEELLKGHLQVQGDVGQGKDDLVKMMQGEVDGDELEKIVGVELRERWTWLKEKQRVEADPSISFCLRSSCRAAVPKPPPDPAVTGEQEKLRVCPSCDFAFCCVCLHTWHGVRNPCAFPQSSLIVSSWLEGDEAERTLLERRYGRANVERMVRVFEEERQNREWMDGHSRQCPGCQARIEKSQGCAHMICARCGSHFCYVCEHTLPPSDPYKHYSTPGSSCYNKLFDFRPGAEPPIEEWLDRVLDEDLAAAA